ncbi:DUF3883 domain-containing protein [Rhizobium sp. 9T]|uniref:DUF3883 domain-containing protein n=1 Tax=Rhizobium croatiense TaxID=2867516 RepID=UPI001C935B3E|nr:DUF3883 domain-containing protein [Rhizobium croatiense]MBY4606376.1 DUF3883 domain-containing protein [Rhizobium croatiense]
MKKVLWVKFGWSEYYRGGPIDGNFGWLKDNKGKKNEGRGHEAFNFLPGEDGTYYCYVPPQKKEYAPWNDDNTGWTVICLAKHPKHAGIHVVGWYEDATLLGEWKKPPRSGKSVGSVTTAYDWSYCITSKSAFFVPPEHRKSSFSDPTVRQGKYSFLAGPDVDTNSKKVRVLSIVETKLRELAAVAVHNPSEDKVPDPEVDPADPLSGFGTPEHRKKVEKAAEASVIAYYRAKGFDYEDCTKINCGYDFLFSKGPEAIHVEVKGTASDTPAFFLTRNEHDTGYLNDPQWRLAMVTGALSAKPKLIVFDAMQLKKAFDLTPLIFIGKSIPSAGQS